MLDKNRLSLAALALLATEATSAHGQTRLSDAHTQQPRAEQTDQYPLSAEDAQTLTMASTMMRTWAHGWTSSCRFVVVPLPSDFVFKNENERTIYAESLTILDATLKKFFDQYPTAAALDEAVRRSNLIFVE
jgi:hypothetical protein